MSGSTSCRKCCHTSFHFDHEHSCLMHSLPQSMKYEAIPHLWFTKYGPIVFIPHLHVSVLLREISQSTLFTKFGERVICPPSPPPFAHHLPPQNMSLSGRNWFRMVLSGRNWEGIWFLVEGIGLEWSQWKELV